jgi:hypothetical protein
MVIEKKMNKLGEWAKGKPLGLVIIAQQAAVGVEALSKWLKSTFRLPRLKAGASPRPELGSRAQG